MQFFYIPAFAGMTDLSAENTPTRQLFNSNQQKKIYRFAPQICKNQTIIKTIYVKQLVQSMIYRDFAKF